MTSSESALEERLRHMKWLATALLVMMAVLFVATSLLRNRYAVLNVVWAFSEAALIGGLADWFAVTALFRHPLGLPIPHTAIVPTRKNDIGRALARFIGDHFLIREAVQARLDKIDLAARFGAWLEQERNATLLSRDLSVALDWLLRAVDSAELRASVKLSLRDAFKRISVSNAVATLIDVLASGNHSQALIDQLIHFGREQLGNNREIIRDRIRERSPWWLPKFVDEEIYDQLTTEFERILNEIADDPEHPARADFNARLKTLKHALGSDAALIRKGETLRDEFINHPAVQHFLEDIWLRTRDFLQESFADSDSQIRISIEREVRAIGRSIADDDEVRLKLNRWLHELVVYLVENYRAPLSEIISDTIESWDPNATARRIELHIGRDLQFIRINGTVVGGLVGVILYVAWQALV